MMNMNDEDVDLGLTLRSRNYSIRTRLNDNSSGAGVNADSRMDLAFATSDPISELVWSPQNGLRLKCANSNVADRKPFLLWNVEPSSNGLSQPQILKPDESRDDEHNLTVSRTMLNADNIFVDKGTLVTHSESHGDCDDTESNTMMGEEAGTKAAVQKEENCTNDGDEDLCPPQKTNIEANASSGNIMGLCVANRVEPHEAEPREALEVTSVTETTNINKTNMPNSIPAPPLQKLESSAEKDALYRQKGKEKALSDGDVYGRSLDDEDDIHESIESCNSVGSFLKGVKRQRYDKGVILGSKRMKEQIHGSLGSTSNNRPDSSFLRWISNMVKVKGLSDCNKEDSSFPKTREFACLNMGFETVFQSLYCRNTNDPDTGKENNSIEESRELVVSVKESIRNLPDDNSCEQASLIIVDQPICADIDCSPDCRGSNLAENKVSNRADSFSEQINNTAEKMTRDNPVAISAVPEGQNPPSSLWITRFSSKIPRSEKCDETTEKPVKCSTYRRDIDLDSRVNDAFLKSSEVKNFSTLKEINKVASNTEESVDLKSKNKLCPILPSPEAMASLFARRLDALKCYQTWDLHTSSSKRVSTSDEMRMNTLSNLVNDVKDNLKSPQCDAVAAKNTAAPSEIYHAIRNLRLSRADILRWMNSNVSLSHLNGFFLRLRGATSYTVACITGDGVEDNGCVSNKSIFVNVGRIKSYVASQYVSNHDFLEDELTAWWRSIVDSGCKIPSLDELNAKFDYRKSLGF